MMMRRSIAALTFCLALPAIAFAQAQSGTPEEQKACRVDVRRYCHMARGQDAIADCLKAHRDQLSKACRGVLESHGQ
jgi:hypothetical protein